MSDPKAWVEIVRECNYLPEPDLKKLCEIVSWNGNLGRFLSKRFAQTHKTDTDTDTAQTKRKGKKKILLSFFFFFFFFSSLLSCFVFSSLP
jgi:hypothetical protein